MTESGYKYSYWEMPKSNASVDGMQTVQGSIHNVRAKLLDHDICYKSIDGRDLHLRIMYPDSVDANGKFPAVIHIQGSAWLKQDLRDHLLDFKRIVTAGYAVIVVEYRPAPEYRFPTQVEDAKSAVHYVAEHAQELCIDANNLYLSGDSSGGHTALLCWATWQGEAFNTEHTPLCRINAVVDLYGVVELYEIQGQISALDHTTPTCPEALLIGKKPSDDRTFADQASVLTYITQGKDYPPLLIMHGNKDRTVPFEQSVMLFSKCKELGLDTQFYCVDDADHGGSVFYCEDVLNTIIGYLNKHRN